MGLFIERTNCALIVKGKQNRIGLVTRPATAQTTTKGTSTTTTILPTETLVFDDLDSGIPVQFPEDDVLFFPEDFSSQQVEESQRNKPKPTTGQVFVPGKIMIEGKNGFKITSVLISKDSSEQMARGGGQGEENEFPEVEVEERDRNVNVDTGLRAQKTTTQSPSRMLKTFTAYPNKEGAEPTNTPSDKTEETLLRLTENLVHMAEMVKGLNSTVMAAVMEKSKPVIISATSEDTPSADRIRMLQVIALYFSHLSDR